MFSGRNITHDDINYEQACVLYNLGELIATKASAHACIATIVFA